MKVLNFGSLNIDYVYRVDHFVSKGETLSSNHLDVYSGGKGLNQSIALSRAGAQVYHAGVIGRDGSYLEEILKSAGVNTSFLVKKDDVRTGNAIVQNDSHGDNCILLYGGANRTVSREMVKRTLEHFGPGDLLVLQNEINGIGCVLEEARARGMQIALNPSPIDEELLALNLEGIQYLILNEVEAKAFIGGNQPLLEGLLARFPQTHIILTLGNKGAVYAYGDLRLEQGIYDVPVVDTTAAGDTFTGYFLGDVICGYPVDHALCLASKASSIAVSRKGAAPSIPMREEVERWDAQEVYRPMI